MGVQRRCVRPSRRLPIRECPRLGHASPAPAGCRPHGYACRPGRGSPSVPRTPLAGRGARHRLWRYRLHRGADLHQHRLGAPGCRFVSVQHRYRPQQLAVSLSFACANFSAVDFSKSRTASTSPTTNAPAGNTSSIDTPNLPLIATVAPSLSAHGFSGLCH